MRDIGTLAQHQASSLSLLVQEGMDRSSLQAGAGIEWARWSRGSPLSWGAAPREKSSELLLCKAPGPQSIPSHSHLGGRFNPNWKSNLSRCRDGHFTPIMWVPKGLQDAARFSPKASLCTPQQGSCSPRAVAGARGVWLDVTYE